MTNSTIHPQTQDREGSAPTPPASHQKADDKQDVCKKLRQALKKEGEKNPCVSNTNAYALGIASHLLWCLVAGDDLYKNWATIEVRRMMELAKGEKS